MIRGCIALLLVVCLCSAAPPAGSFRQVPVAVAGGGGPDIAYRSSSHVIATATSATPSEPTGTAQNDLIFANVHCAGAGTITLPAGWLVLTNGVEAFDGFFDYSMAVIRRGASAPDLTWQFGSSVYHEVYLHSISGASTAGTALNAVEVMNRAQGSSGEPNPPSVITSTANDLIVILGVNWSGSGVGGWVAPANYTIRGNNTAGNNGTSATRNSLIAAGAEDPATFTGASGGGINWDAFTYGVKD